LGDDLARQRLVAGDLHRQSRPITSVQAIERQHRHLRLSGPRRPEFRAKRHDQKHWHSAHALDSEVEQLARGRVDPMRVLEHHEHRLLPRQTFQLVD